MNLDDLFALKYGPMITLMQWMQLNSLIANPLVCGGCNIQMSMIERERGHIDGFQWRCSGCKKKRSIRTGSFFEEFRKLSLANLLISIYFWCNEIASKKAAKSLGISRNAISRIYRRLDDICSIDIGINDDFLPFGGPAVLTKCDESMFCHKSKYNRGRRAQNGSWVFGIVTTAYTPSRGYFRVVNRRNRDTLEPIILKCLSPASELHSDAWMAYHGIERRLLNIRRHRVVVHRDNFVDPVTGVHTQEIESAWAQLKQGIKMRRGIEVGDLQTYLDVKMWQQWRGLDDLFGNFLLTLRNQYEFDPV